LKGEGRFDSCGAPGANVNQGTLERLKALRRELLDPKIAEHRGRVVKTTGDGMLVESARSMPCAAASKGITEL
jgi:adenylate cyclase